MHRNKKNYRDDINGGKVDDMKWRKEGEG